MAAKRAKKAKQAMDFDEEDDVLAEMAKELDVDKDELRIKEAHGPSTFGVTAYEITIRGGGHKEWNVVQNDDAERELALAIVKQDLEEQPEIFNQDFIESHIDIDRLRRELEGDVQNFAEEDLRDTAERDPDEFWREYEREGFDAPEEDEEGNRREPEDSEIEELATKRTEDLLKDPMEYLRDSSGDDAAKEAIRIAGIDIDAAAEDAIDADGAAHFLSSYDGNTATTDAGFVYWRVN